MSQPRPSEIPEEVVARRLEDLAQIDRLMRALREVRFVDAPSHVAEESPPFGAPPPPPPHPRDA